MHNISKYFLLFINIIYLIFITSCTNKKITILENDIRKISVTDSKGYLVKTYYEKYHNKYDGWLKANCEKTIDFELFNDSYKCQFTNTSIILINNSNKNIIDKQTYENLNIKNNHQEEESQEEESQEEESQEENPIPLNPPTE